MTVQQLDTLLIEYQSYFMSPSPEIPKHDERFEYSGTSFSTALSRESLCIWALEHGALKLRKIQEGNFQTRKDDIVADWFSSRVYLSSSPSLIKMDSWINFEQGHAVVISGIENADHHCKKYTLKDIADYAEISEDEAKQCLVDLKFLRRAQLSRTMLVTQEGSKYHKNGWLYEVLLIVDDLLTKRELTGQKQENSDEPLSPKPINIRSSAARETKICKSCNTRKPTSEFWKSTRKKDGYTTWCKQCHGHKNEISRKICKSCGVMLATSLFWKSSRQKDGYTAWCQNCHSK